MGTAVAEVGSSVVEVKWSRNSEGCRFTRRGRKPELTCSASTSHSLSHGDTLQNPPSARETLHHGS